MEQTQPPVAFEIKIESCRHSTWQGKLVLGGQAIAFGSEIDLLLAIQALLCGKAEAACLENGL